ncbi:unnamed protein product [Triticum turgidum subsp. durum]|uniref:Peroxidase n=1 Tax=Triticum turgidum subsp. durum TaxID=4567 RepID=A0A9R1RUR4_TRITD|nr:unnamed protein product [Triticum turgidum subsp. durum]
MKSSRAAATIVVLALAFAVHSSPAAAKGLSPDFYAMSCPQLGQIVRSHVAKAFRRDPGVAPALVRIFFHDCFPQGCDASVLLTGNNSEQALGPNLTLRPMALKLIDDIHAGVEATCPRTVSCADVTVLATRDALLQAGGPYIDFPLGRRDGLTPASADLVLALPAPSFDVPTLISSFGNRSLGVADLVALSGAHTFGVAHCPSFSDRFTPIIDANPAIGPKFAKMLQAKCAKDVPEGTVTQALDGLTPKVFDNLYYTDLITRRGLLKSDQGLIDHPDTKGMATQFALNQLFFFDEFAHSMVKMSYMDVLTGSQGEIRLNCAVPNTRAEGIETANDEGHAANM